MVGKQQASLFNSNKNINATLSKVYVQVKLTVIPTEKTEQIVP